MADCGSSLMGEYVQGEQNDKAESEREKEGFKAFQDGGVLVE